MAPAGPPAGQAPGATEAGMTEAGATETGAVVRQAAAKLNLWLHVVGRRPDGLHLLDSLVAFADFGDTLRAVPAEDVTLSIDGPFAAGLAADSGNLVLRAARLLRSETGVARGAHLHLTKRLPVAAGIGGGSADAAATLHALATLWGLAPEPGWLQRLGVRIGADVPVCLAAVPSCVGGIGEILAPAPALPPAALVLVNPGLALATAEVFGVYAETGPGPGASAGSNRPPLEVGPFADAAALAARLAATRNDLSAAALRLAPAIAEVLAAIEAQAGCRLARMSGSGATCFGLFDDAAAAEAAAAALVAGHPGWWVQPTALRRPPPAAPA